MSSVLMPRPRKTSISSSPKSPPTTATTRTSVKKLADREKCAAEPPSILSRLPKGVSTASNATEPTTSNDTFYCSPFESRQHSAKFFFVPSVNTSVVKSDFLNHKGHRGIHRGHEG